MSVSPAKPLLVGQVHFMPRHRSAQLFRELPSFVGNDEFGYTGVLGRIEDVASPTIFRKLLVAELIEPFVGAFNYIWVAPTFDGFNSLH